MKRKIYTGAILLAIAATAAWNTSVGSKADSMLSDVALANVEALASGELTEEDCDKVCRYSDTMYCEIGLKVNGEIVETKMCYYMKPRD